MTHEPKIRVFSVDDHPLLREGIAAIINNEPDMVMVAQAATGRDAIHQFREHRPDVTLMDLRLPDIGGIDWKFGVWSPTLKKFRQTTQGWVTDDWDVQRSRGLPESTRQSGVRDG